MFVNYSLRAGRGQGPEPALQRSARAAAQPVPAGLAADRTGRQADDQQDLAELGLQHGRPADLPDQRHALHARRSTSPGSAATPTSSTRGSRASGTSRSTGGPRSASARGVSTSRPYGSTRGAADLREAVSRRRIQHPRLRHPHRRPARSGNGHRARRQQEPAVQRRVPDQHRRPGAPGAVRRRRPGARHRRAASPGRKTDPAHGAGAADCRQHPGSVLHLQPADVHAGR